MHALNGKTFSLIMITKVKYSSAKNSEFILFKVLILFLVELGSCVGCLPPTTKCSQNQTYFLSRPPCKASPDMKVPATVNDSILLPAS